MLSNNMFLKKFIKVFICAIVVFMMSEDLLYAAPKADRVVARKKVGIEKPAKKTISGEISYVDKKYVSIVVRRDDETKAESEIGFWIDEGMQANWRKKLSEMKYGDKIQIEYDQILQDYDEIKANGTVERKTKIEKLTAKNIKFLAPAKSKLRSD